MSVSDADLERFYGSISAMSNKDWNTFVDPSEFDYQGFDGKEVVRIFLERAKKAGASEQVTQSDLAFLITFAVTFGSITVNNYKKFSDKVKKYYDDLTKKYELKMSAKGQGNQVLTVSRINAAFPVVACRMMYFLHIKDFSGECNSQTLPRFMKNNAFSAIIPHTAAEGVKELVVFAILGFAIDQGCVINDPKKVKTIEDKKRIGLEQLGFIRAAERANWPLLGARKGGWNVFINDIVAHYDSILAVANHAARLVGETVSFGDKSAFTTLD